MNYLIGKKELFAVEVNVSTNKWGHKTALWLNNTRIGDWQDKNLLAPFINSLYRVALKNEDLWLNELEGLNCRQVFLTTNPFYNNPDKFYDLAVAEQEKLTRFDKFLFNWGENFDRWHLQVIVRKNICKFLWIQPTAYATNTYEARNNIQCFDVPLAMVQEVYYELGNLIPEKYWPSTALKK